MLRKNVRALATDKKYRPLAKNIARLAFVISLLWFAAFPYLSRGHFTAENALDASGMDTKLDKDLAARPQYARIKNELESFKRGTDTLAQTKLFIQKELSQNFEVYRQEKYIYSYIRSSGGYGGECNILSFPINYPASVSIALTFMNVWAIQDPQWLSKDVVVVFYDDASAVVKDKTGEPAVGVNYSKSMEEFLKWWYIGHDGEDSFDVSQLLNQDKRIHGRCGLLRQGFPFILKDYQWNKFALHVEGINAKTSDLDYLNALNQAIGVQGFSWDYFKPAYFRKNKFIAKATELLAPKSRKQFSLRDRILDGMEAIVKLIEHPDFNRHENVMYYLESLKNALTGKVHYPHGHMIDKGIQAVTIEAVMESKKKKSDKATDSTDEINRMTKFLGLMESLVRGFDQLDEQLHAGDYFYVLINASKFVNNSIFIWPAVLLILSYFLPNLLDFTDYMEEQENIKQGTSGSGAEALFIACSYSLGFVFIFLPQIVTGQADFYHLKPQDVDACTTKTLSIIGATSIAFILCFNAKFYGQMDLLIFKFYNWFIVSVIMAALIVYAFPVVLIGIVFVFPLLHNSVSLFGCRRAKSAKGWVVSNILFLAWLALGLSVLLGTILFSDASPATKLSSLKSMVTTIIIDYQCVGSNLWTYFCVLFVPNVLNILQVQIFA